MSSYFRRNLRPLFYAKHALGKMNLICEPLFRNTGITQFSYLRFLRDGRVLNLTTDEKWIEHRFDNEIKYKILFEEALEYSCIGKPYVYLWPTDKDDPLLKALYEFDIWNGCNYYILNEACIEVFSFASPRSGKNMQNFYVNNTEIMNSFILYLREQIRDEITFLKTDDFIQTDLELPSLVTPSPASNIFNGSKSISTFEPKRVHLSNDSYLTLREIQCCSYLLRGESYKTIARKLGISDRTVETHLREVKAKTNCASNLELIHFFEEKRWIFDVFSWGDHKPEGIIKCNG